MDRISTLSRLDQIDHERDELAKRLREADRTFSDASLVTRARDAFESEQKLLADLRAKLRDHELETQTLDAKIKEIESRLYGGRITIPKELESLEKDRAMHLRLRGELDDKVLELMDTVEESQKSADKKSAAFRGAEQTRALEVDRLGREKQTLSTRLAKLNSEFDQTRAALESDALHVYDQLRKSRPGRVMAHLKKNSCGACGMEAPSGMVARVQVGEEIVLCSGCGRILAD